LVVRETVGVGVVAAAGVAVDVDVVVVVGGAVCVCADASAAPAQMTMMARDKFLTRVLDLGETLEISNLRICCGMGTGMKRTRRHRPLVISSLRPGPNTDRLLRGREPVTLPTNLFLRARKR
jgi:hypothetical protein